MDQTVDEILNTQSLAEIRASVSEADLVNMRSKLVKEFRAYYNGKGVNVSDDVIGKIVDNIPPDSLKRRVVSQRIYDVNYHGKMPPKQVSISQDEFKAQLGRYDGPNGSADGWHVRGNKQGPELDLNGDLRRFYVNVMPDKAAELADYVANQLNAKGIRFNFKMLENLKSFDRADAGVLAVQRSDYQAVKTIVLDYARKHPEAFAVGSQAFTKPISKGVAVAAEPAQMNLPFRMGRHSFGQAYTDVVAETLLKAPANATKEEIKELVRQSLRQHGFDPARPWLKQGSKVDDL